MTLVSVRWPAHPLAEIARTVLGGETAAAHEAFIRSKKLNKLVDKAQRKGLRRYLGLSAAGYARALRQRIAATETVEEMFASVDALVAPSLIGGAVTLETNLGRRFRRGHIGTSVLGAVAGVPALAVPMGVGPSGLPLSLSITGSLFGEDTILQIGMIYQQETDWHRRRPPEASASHVLTGGGGGS